VKKLGKRINVFENHIFPRHSLKNNFNDADNNIQLQYLVGSVV